MKRLVISYFIILLFILSSCNSSTEHQFELKVLEHIYYEKLSSASGVSISDGKIFLIGDDIPWLVQVNKDLSIGNMMSLSGIDSIVDGRTPYELKADYECMETFEDDGFSKTLVLSSGSKINARDTAILILKNTSPKIIKRNIRPVFEEIKKRANTGDEEINIEGLAVGNEKVFLFHRGNISGNFIAVLDKKDFLHFIETGHSHHPSIDIFPFELPSYNDVQSGFSGACLLPDVSGILFTASMEDTKSVTADGIVLGSYIGLIPINKLSQGTFYATLLENEGEILAKKLEGITIKEINGREMEIISVCDNDDGSSDLFIIQLLFKEKL